MQSHSLLNKESDKIYQLLMLIEVWLSFVEKIV